MIAQLSQSITWTWQVLFSSHSPSSFSNCIFRYSKANSVAFKSLKISITCQIEYSSAYLIFISPQTDYPDRNWVESARKHWNVFFRNSVRTYQTVFASHELLIKDFVLNSVPFGISTVIVIFPRHTDQWSYRPIMGPSRKGTKFTSIQLKIIYIFIPLRDLVLGWQVPAFICTQYWQIRVLRIF